MAECCWKTRWQQLPAAATVVKKVGAIAGEELPAGVKSPVITAATPIDVSTVFWSEDSHLQIEHALKVTVKNGLMQSSSSNRWMEHVQLSSNCHVQNMLIMSDATGEGLFLQTLRDIHQMEPLYAWFSMECARMFAIPFLSLKNIEGEQHYRCHQCSVLYRNPNPLKIHLAFFCKATASTAPCPQHPQWPELSRWSNSSFPSNVYPGAHSSAFATSTSSATLLPHTMPVPLLKCNLPVVSQLMSVESPQTMSGGQSFLSSPLELVPRSRSIPSSCVGLSCIVPDVGHRPETSATSVHCGETSNIRGPFRDQDADESPRLAASATVTSSSCPRTKRQHKCCYCGKMYSRKYGLKIHIRTHTGYKPLKCKVCLRPFGDPSNLNKHIRLHAEGDTPYRCHFCGKVLVRRRDLDRHLKSRHAQDVTGKVARNQL